MSSSDDARFDASKAMLSAALGGLLCFGSSACIGTETLNPLGDDSSSAGVGAGGSTSSAGETASATTSSSSDASTGVASTTVGVSSSAVASSSASDGATTSSGAGGAPANPHTPIPDTACMTGISPTPMVTSSSTVTLTKDQFMAMCDQANGIFEIQPLCGGSNACRGFAYDSGTTTLTEHTCQATNSCAGYNCVVCT